MLDIALLTFSIPSTSFPSSKSSTVSAGEVSIRKKYALLALREFKEDPQWLRVFKIPAYLTKTKSTNRCCFIRPDKTKASLNHFQLPQDNEICQPNMDLDKLMELDDLAFHLPILLFCSILFSFEILTFLLVVIQTHATIDSSKVIVECYCALETHNI